MRRSILASGLVLLLHSEAATMARAQAPYQLPHTETRRLASEATGVDYVLYVSLPRDYRETDRRYPLVVTLDADYAFALAHNIIEHYVDRGNLPELIVVGVAYEGASQDPAVYRRNRTRDYTPTHTLEGGYGREFQKLSGGGTAFRDFLEKELVPFLSSRYRVMPDDRTFVGHSYGGLFGAFVLLSKPELFQRYILVSPSLWYDERWVFDLEKRYRAEHESLEARVFLAVGGFENPPRRRLTMVEDLERLGTLLESRAYRGLELETVVFPEETHNSVFPAALSRGLRVVFSRFER